jgi:hypothetical protein
VFRACAWCGILMGVALPLEDSSTTHGMCPGCFERMQRERIGPKPNVLVVVRPDQPALTQHLVQALCALPSVIVLTDRRHGERRRTVDAIAAERRKRDRRQRWFSQGAAWVTLGVQVIPVQREPSASG